MLGETDPELYRIFEAEGPEELWLAGRDWAVESNLMAVGGRSLALRTPGGHYEGVYLPLHGRHQADNFAAALAGAEAFFGAPLEGGIVAGAAAAVRSPGRLEVVGRNPLLVLDGAKNVAGARASAVAVAEEFGEATSRVMVVGMLKGKSALEMLEALDAPQARLVVACPPPSPPRAARRGRGRRRTLPGVPRYGRRFGRASPRAGPGGGRSRRTGAGHGVALRSGSCPFRTGGGRRREQPSQAERPLSSAAGLAGGSGASRA